MKRVSGLLAAAGLLSLAFATAAFAQQPAEGVVIKQQRIIQGPEGGPPPPDANFVFIATESFGGKTVKGAPYSAEAVTETIQTLSDGNRIINRITSSLYRDSEGRTRREEDATLTTKSANGPVSTVRRMISIVDPVAGYSYSLEPENKIAERRYFLTGICILQTDGAAVAGRHHECGKYGC